MFIVYYVPSIVLGARDKRNRDMIWYFPPRGQRPLPSPQEQTKWTECLLYAEQAIYIPRLRPSSLQPLTWKHIAPAFRREKQKLN